MKKKILSVILLAVSLLFVCSSCLSAEKLLSRLSLMIDEMYDRIDVLEAVSCDCSAKNSDVLSKAQYVRDVIIPAMDALRAIADKLEEICPANIWPVPSYGKLMYNF